MEQPPLEQPATEKHPMGQHPMGQPATGQHPMEQPATEDPPTEDPGVDEPLYEPGQVDSVIRTTAYRRRDFGRSVLWFNTDDDDKEVLKWIAEPFPSEIIASLGMLSIFPIELIWMILECLDIKSSFKFRQVNRYARRLVSDLPDYRAVARDGLPGLRAVLKTGIAESLTMVDLYRPLLKGTCTVCRKDFGGFLFLPTVTRCCYPCISSAPSLRVVSLFAIQNRSGIPGEKLRRLLPVVRTIPGRYAMIGNIRIKRAEVVSERRAIEVLRAMGYPITTKDIAFNTAAAIDYAYVWRFMVSTVLPRLDRRTGRLDHGLSCKGCQIVLENPREYWPEDVFERRDRIFSRQGYLRHFPYCYEAIKLWRESRGGTVPVRESEFVRCGGHMHAPGEEVETDTETESEFESESESESESENEY